MSEGLKAKGIKLLNDLKSISQNRQAIQYGLPVILLLLLINTIQVARFNAVIAPLTHYSEGLVDDLGNFRQDISSFGKDLNEMRSFLLLPPRDYSFTEKEAEESASDQKTASDTEEALYLTLEKFVNERVSAQNAEQVRSLMPALLKNQALINGLKENQMNAGKLSSLETALSFKIGTPEKNYFEVLGELNTGKFTLRDTLGGSVVLSGTDEGALSSEILAEVAKNKTRIEAVQALTVQNQAALAEALKNENFIKLLESRKLMIPDNPEIQADPLKTEIQNQDGAVLLTISIGPADGKIRLDEKEIPEGGVLLNQLIAGVSRLDGTTASEQKTKLARAELEAVLKESAFSELLHSGGLKVSLEPRDEYNQLLYDVTDTQDVLQFSFVIEKSSGAVKILKDNRETDLLSVLEQTSKKKL